MAKNKPKEKPVSARSRSLEPGTADGQFAEFDEPINPPLIPDSDMPPAVEAVPVQNNRVIATYVGMALAADEDEKLVGLDFSMTLTKDHGGLIPERVFDEYKHLLKTDNKETKLQHVEDLTVDIFETPEKSKSELHLSAASVRKASVTMIEETGKGKTKHVVRFAFRLEIARTEKVIAFAAWRDGEQFWLSMGESQGSIK